MDGCGKRTLERALQAMGITTGMLRLASMIIGATNQLQSDTNLTHIAATRAFRIWPTCLGGRAIKAKSR
jgi:chemotaxis regulatin CheY-phosphate phosphatase CheZ